MELLCFILIFRIMKFNKDKIIIQLVKNITEFNDLDDALLKTLSQLKENIKTANSLIKLAEKEGNIFAKAEADLERA